MLDVNNFDSMRIGLASPEQITKWSFGEVRKPETINYRTLKPERDGLFCEKIFGPTKDWECHCGKYKRVRYKGVVCDRCGVEVTRSKVRRDRMGHIELAAPVSHIWYFKGIPSRMGLILNLSPRSLERVLYFAYYIVLDSGETPLAKGSLLSEQEYSEARDKYGESFVVGMGAEAIKQLLKEIDLGTLADSLREELKEATGQRKVKAVRRLEVCEAFKKSGNRPEWMIMDIVPVIPPELRPMVQLDGGRFATSDLNDLYRRVINRNNRLKKLLAQGAPNIIVRNEKRMLQEAVDALIDNGRRGRPVTGPGNRPLKSLSDMLKGKQGRFRQNLLGKRVDYSGRSVIVVGPELKMHQCGLPKEMALELFKPFVMKKLVNSGQSPNIKNAKQRVERANAEVWDVLEDVIKEHPVLLNRAPTLHRLGIQAFEPILSEGRAIKIHPLVCTAYNADFDGDQMAVHVPLSAEAQAEARLLMLSAHNILAPKDGKPVAVPSQDMILGAYYLTIIRDNAKGEGTCYTGINEALLAYHHQELHLQARIKVRIPNKEIYGHPDQEGRTLVNTTVGNAIFNEVLPLELRYFYQKNGEWHLEKLVGKKELGELVAKSFKLFGNTRTASLLDDIKKMGFANACRAGITIAVSDIKVPERKAEILARTEVEVDRTEGLFRRGLLSEDERYKTIIKLWTETTQEITDELMQSTLDAFNPVYMMANSGARGNKQQIRQLAGMRGLMADPSGRIIDLPIKANFREGLTVLEYFISTHGARKGLADTALRTADSGYLTRRLVDVAQDVIVREDDCDVTTFDLNKAKSKLRRVETGCSAGKLEEILTGRNLAQTIVDPETNEVIAEADSIIDATVITAVVEKHILAVVVYAKDSEDANATETIICNVPMDKLNKILKADIMYRVGNYPLEEDVRDANAQVVFAKGTVVDENVVDTILASDGVSTIKVRNDEIVGIEVSVITDEKDEKTVIVPLKDRLEGRTLAEDICDPETGEVLFKCNNLITEDDAAAIAKLKKVVLIRSVLNCKSKYGVCKKCYGKNLATGQMVDIGEAVGIIAAQSIGEPGTQLTMRTFHTGGVAGDDITQGLPRVEELFEARKPKRAAVLVEQSGKVNVTTDPKGNKRILVTDENKEEHAYQIPYGSKLHVETGDIVKIGDRLTEGSKNPHDVLRLSGMKAAQEYIVGEVQRVYKSQGVEINDRHLEVMVRQMMRKIKIEEAGDTEMLPGELIDINEFNEANKLVMERGLEPAQGRGVVLGITKASLATDSFLSAASFQETTRVLTDAAIKGKIDPLLGLKENVIIGKLVPAGTGMSRYRNINIRHN